jgi:hypothetical protein
MNGSLEEAYVAVERAYGQGDFTRALQLANALRPQVEAGRPDLLDHRLALLIGHIHLYGLNQRQEAEEAYGAVYEGCSEPSYRELASQGLALSRQPMSTPITPASAAPWMGQGQDPQPVQGKDAGGAATPWQSMDPQAVIPVVVTVEDNQSKPAKADRAASPEKAPQPVAATTPSGFSEEEWADLAKGLLLVELSSNSGQPTR